MLSLVATLCEDGLIKKISKICLDEINETNFGILNGFDFEDFHFKFGFWHLDEDDDHKARTIYAFISETRPFAEIEIFEWLKSDIKFYTKRYSNFIENDVVYCDEKGNTLNDSHAKQNEFIYQLKEFITRFYQYFFAELKI